MVRGASPVAVFAEVERRATPLAFGTPVQVSPTTWTLPDGTGAAAFRFDVQKAGRHCIRIPGSSGHAFTVYQDGRPVIDTHGGLTTLPLAMGPAWVLVVAGPKGTPSLAVYDTDC